MEGIGVRSGPLYRRHAPRRASMARSPFTPLDDMSPDFIEVYPDALDAAACRRLVERFDASAIARRGETGGGVDAAVKDSWDIPLHLHPEWADAQQVLNDAVLVSFRHYL